MQILRCLLMRSFVADTSIAPLPSWFHLACLSMRVCITTRLFKFCSCCYEEQKMGLSLLKLSTKNIISCVLNKLHELIDSFITFSKLCYIVGDLGKFKGIQLILIISFLILNSFKVMNQIRE